MSIPSIEILYHPHSMMLLVVVFENLYHILKNIDLHILTLLEVLLILSLKGKYTAYPYSIPLALIMHLTCSSMEVDSIMLSSFLLLQQSCFKGLKLVSDRYKKSLKHES